MVSVKIENDIFCDLLLDRVKYWTDDADVIELYRRMYEQYAKSGIFDGVELDIPVIVDNDYVNYTSVLSPGEDGYEGIKKLYNEGEYDISCEYDNNMGYSFIEAEYNGYFLLRH